MKVMMIVQELDAEGSVMMVSHDWARALAKRVERLAVIAARVGTHDLPANAEVVDLDPDGHASSARKGWRLLFEAGRRLALGRMDVVFVHMVPKHALALAPLCKMLGKPLCLWYTSHGTGAALRLVNPVLDAAVTATIDSYPFPGPKIVAIGHGIDTDRFRPGLNSKDHPPVIFYAARLTPIKLVEIAIRAMDEPALREHPAGPVLEIAGEPFYPADRLYLAQLRALVASRDLNDRVRFVRNIPGERMPAALCRSTLALSLRGAPALDKNGIEAMAAGVPLLTNNPSFGPSLGEFKGMLFAEGGDPATIARLAATLLDDPGLAARIANSLRLRAVEEHGLEGFADRLVGVFESVLSGARPLSSAASQAERNP